MTTRQAPAVARRTLLAAGCAAPLLSLAPLRAAAQAPLASAKIVLGAPAGGSGDLMARKLADRLRSGYAGSVVVENRTGAGGQLALSHVKDAPADGSVLLLVPSSHVAVYPSTYRRLPYHPVDDFAPVGLVAHANMAFGIGPSVPASVKTLADYLAWAKANPGQASYGSPASGSIAHLLAAYVGQSSGVALTHVAYRGSTNALQDLRGGTLPALSAPAGAFLPHLAGGQIRLLAVSGEARSRFLPNVPTFREQGIALTAREWYGFFLPAKASRETVQRASAALRAVLAQADMAEALTQFGLEPASSTPQQLAAMLAADTEEWKAVVRKTGFTAES